MSSQHWRCSPALRRRTLHHYFTMSIFDPPQRVDLRWTTTGSFEHRRRLTHHGTKANHNWVNGQRCVTPHFWLTALALMALRVQRTLRRRFKSKESKKMVGSSLVRDSGSRRIRTTCGPNAIVQLSVTRVWTERFVNVRKVISWKVILQRHLLCLKALLFPRSPTTKMSVGHVACTMVSGWQV
ncbi:hypothetical protein EDC04DRAFT_392032 [Pisolithus marmoratus]|nr:hypothetical protein EDC04DRAFT_392032 [Pisolithus marmoratus]